MKTHYSKKLSSLLFAASLGLTGCSNNLLTKTISSPSLSSGSSNSNDGNTESGTTDSSSRVTAPTTATTYSKEVAICNSKNLTYLKTQLMVYYENSSTPLKNVIRMWIPRIAYDFNVSNYQVKFFKFKTNEKGEVWTDPDPLKLKIEKKVGFVSITDNFDSLNWKLMKTALAAKSITIDTLEKTFANYSFVLDLRDKAGDYEGLQIAVYNGIGNKVEEGNMLLPPFYAHPVSYSAYNSYLKSLHPFIDMIGSAWTVDLFKEQLNKNCFY